VQSLDLSPQADKLEHAIHASFLAGFRLAMLIAAGLAVASAVAATLIMKGKDRTTKAERTSQPEGKTAPA
jgi:hypothetical protein